MSSARPIRVMIVDDHMMVRKGLSAVLMQSEHIELVGEAREGQEAVLICETQRVDVVLMDLVMPEMGGPEATRIIRQRWPSTQVVALTSFEDKDLVQEALRAGAISYLLKNVSASDLLGAIYAAHEGHTVLAPEVAQSLVEAAQEGPKPGSDLTPREHEVLALLVEGLTNPEIAARLVVSTSTARAHVSNILSKLGASNRVEAVSLAMRHRLVP